MFSLTFVHAFFAFWTLTSGILVYISKEESLWSKPKIWLYLIPHLVTAITGLFLRSSFEPISPFKVLTIKTMLAFARMVYLILKNEYVRARRTMFGAYIGLVIAFVGTLHPDRLFGDMLFGQFMKFSFELSQWIWIGLMIVSTVCGIIFGILDKRKSTAKLI
jgi:uncharacterized membrane protein